MARMLTTRIIAVGDVLCDELVFLVGISINIIVTQAKMDNLHFNNPSNEISLNLMRRLDSSETNGHN